MGFFLPSRSLSPLATECCYFVNLFCLPPGTAAAALMAKKKSFAEKHMCELNVLGATCDEQRDTHTEDVEEEETYVDHVLVSTHRAGV